MNFLCVEAPTGTYGNFERGSEYKVHCIVPFYGEEAAKHSRFVIFPDHANNPNTFEVLGPEVFNRCFAPIGSKVMY